MSPRWNRTVRLRVGPHRAAATLERVWPRRAELASASRDGDELGAVEPVLRELEQASALDGAPLNVELSDAAVHLDVIEGDFAEHNAPMLEAVAAACVGELLGDDAQAHDVQWQLQPDGRHLLICAVARSHIDALAEQARALGLRLASVQPDFVSQWNRHAGALTSGSAVFAVASGPALAIAWVADGIISAISVATRPDAGLSWVVPAGNEPGRAGDDRAAAFDELDARVDRLLAGIGQDPGAQAAFVLAAPDVPTPAASPRWTLAGREATGQ